MNFPTATQRMKSLFLFLLLALYTVYTKVVLKNYEFDILVVSNIISIISMLYIKITTRSIYALNHYKQYSFVYFINKVAKLLIFVYAAMLYYEALNNATLELFDLKLYEMVPILFGETYYAGEYFGELFLNKPLECISFVFTILVFIPSFFYFLALNIKIIFKIIVWFIPFVNLIVFLKWLFRGTYIFFEYKKDDENFYIINTRKITNKFYILNKFLLKLLLVAAIVVVIYLYFKFF